MLALEKRGLKVLKPVGCLQGHPQKQYFSAEVEEEGEEQEEVLVEVEIVAQEEVVERLEEDVLDDVELLDSKQEWENGLDRHKVGGKD